MYVVKNALKNLGRNKGRNFLVGVVIFIITLTISVSFIIYGTTEKIIQQYKNKFGTQIVIAPDIQKIEDHYPMGNGGSQMAQKIPSISSETYQKLTESTLLKEYTLTNELMLFSDTIKPVDTKDSTSHGGNTFSSSITGGGKPVNIPTMRLKGSTNFDTLTEFAEGTRKILAGTVYQNPMECIVSKELADLNGLSVGSDIRVTSQGTVTKKETTFQVVGVYEDVTSAFGNHFFKESLDNRRNEILTSYDSVSQSAAMPDNVMTNASYVLKEPHLLGPFQKEAKDAGVPASYQVSGDEESYNRIVGPVEGLSKMMKTFLTVVLLFGAVILVLISMITMRERKYEIGVLRAMGMKKIKVVTQCFLEMASITGICLLLGLLLGGVLSQPVADVLLKDQIQQVEQNKNPLHSMVISNKNEENIPTIKQIRVSFGGKEVLQISVVAMLLTILASVGSLVYITKYEPMEILSERGNELC